MECSDFDSAPHPIKQERFRERWECLSQEATTQLLNQIKPRLALSGHTHHGCTRLLPTGDGIEITIPSFSWRNKDNPNFGLVSVTCICCTICELVFLGSFHAKQLRIYEM